MKSLIALLVLGALPLLAAIRDDGSQIDPGTHTDAVDIGIVLRDGDARMNLANQCLKRMLRDGSGGDKADLLRVLAITGFSLTKVSAAPLPEDPTRIRFGFEFSHREQVKTIYWEADCPVEIPENEMAAR
jgi:hypothetical protein